MARTPTPPWRRSASWWGQRRPRLGHTPSPQFRYLAHARKLHYPPPPRGRRRCYRHGDQATTPPRPWRERIVELGGSPPSAAEERGVTSPRALLQQIRPSRPGEGL